MRARLNVGRTHSLGWVYRSRRQWDCEVHKYNHGQH